MARVRRCGATTIGVPSHPDHPDLPAGAELVRTTDEFTPETMPAGLRRAHRTATGVWGRLRVLSGSIEFTFEGDAPSTHRVAAGEEQIIPPDVPHSVAPAADARFVVDFLKPAS